MVSKSLLPSLLKKQLSYTLTPQPLYAYNSNTWQPTPSPPSQTPNPQAFHSLHLITWNIDFMAPHRRPRMTAALAHLAHLLTLIPATSLPVIFLQEMSQETTPIKGRAVSTEDPANDLEQLMNEPWVRERFYMSDLDGGRWGAGYGCVVLVDLRVCVGGVGRLRLVSEFGRDVLVVDVRLKSGDGDGDGDGDGGKVLRLCNVHLDSLEGAMRPVQWKALAGLAQEGVVGSGSGRAGDRVVAAVVAGDCNATRPRDRTEPMDNGFKDAYLELGGVEGDEEGATWGFQSLGWERFGRSRLDKVVFWGDLEIGSLERVGVGVKIVDSGVVEELEKLGELTYATDHYGLLAVFAIKDGLQTVESTKGTASWTTRIWKMIGGRT